MRIEQVQIAPIGDESLEFSATYNGQRLFYRIPAKHFHEQAMGDALLLSTLGPAMIAGLPLQVPDEYAVSSQLVANLDAIQR